ncbi:hypothetical protein T02_3896 [Trichinella nativa]|uniref:Uncharacterized protein n=1 Tax=Trichinella nativa TaxID=6335 RepID=A0A0V1KX50_9BILA|nr:hypothetical protein T02_3896 [Trichinella nativa]
MNNKTRLVLVKKNFLNLLSSIRFRHCVPNGKWVLDADYRRPNGCLLMFSYVGATAKRVHIEQDVRFNPQAVGELNDARVVWIRLMERRAVMKHYKNLWLVVAQELSVSTLKKSVKISSHSP